MNFPRAAGILLPVSSLPSPYGIGSLGKEAYAFIDFLKEARQTYWQVLPLHPTSFGDSPYQSFSAFAGNPYFIDLEQLALDGLLTPAEITAHRRPAGPVDYAWLFESRLPLLRQAFGRFSRRDPGFEAFLASCDPALDDYALFMALKEHFGYAPWTQWPAPLRTRDPEALAAFSSSHRESVAFWKFLQYLFQKQWENLTPYAGIAGVCMIGDIPIYVAQDSADVWANQQQFLLDENGNPLFVAGCPPDDYAATGQRWGNPLYDWDIMAADGFSWWRKRITACARWYDVLRIDHFLGMARYYAIPAAHETAKEGEWRQGPGKALTDAIQEAAGPVRLLAENLGVLHPTVRELLEQTGFPGMRVLLFGGEPPDNEHLPHRFSSNLAVYVGTHDNETAVGFCNRQTARELFFLMQYYHVKKKKQLPGALIRAAFQSVADTVIIQAQDWLKLDNRARMNTPSTLGGNWQWRLLPDELNDRLAAKIRRLTYLYDRTP